ncbi:hypothetical protein CTA2_3115 [Colletotrichum tanaceti]|nr:hypothetical protein CTA2_3115 [Colletotrichum tanaceti]
MQFTTILVALLPALAAGKVTQPVPVATMAVLAPNDLPFSDRVCSKEFRDLCAPSSDGVKRCILVKGSPLCAIDCESQSTCRTQCRKRTPRAINGYCTTGDHPCICSDVDAGFDQYM